MCPLGAQVAFDKCQFRVRHFGGVFTSPYKITWATCCSAALHVASWRFGRESSVIIDRRLPVRAPGSSSTTTATKTTALAAGGGAARAEGTLGASNPRASTLIPSRASGAHLAMRSTAECDFACARLAPRPRSTRAIFACVILAGSFFARTNLHAQLSLFGRLRMSHVVHMPCVSTTA